MLGLTTIAFLSIKSLGINADVSSMWCACIKISEETVHLGQLVIQYQNFGPICDKSVKPSSAGPWKILLPADCSSLAERRSLVSVPHSRARQKSSAGGFGPADRTLTVPVFGGAAVIVAMSSTSTRGGTWSICSRASSPCAIDQKPYFERF